MHIIMKREMDITYFFICLSIVASSLKAYGYLIGSYNISIFRFTAVMALFFIVIKMILFQRFVIIDKYIKSLFIIVIISLLQLLYSNPDRLLSSNFLYIIFDYTYILFVFVYVITFKKDYRNILKSIIFSLTIPVVLGIYQTGMLSITGIKPALPFHQFVVIENTDTYYIYTRINSCFNDPSHFATILILAILISFGFLLNSRDLKLNTLNKIFFVFLLGGSLLCLATSMSGSGVVGLFGGIVFSFFINKVRIRKIFRLIFLVSIMMALFFLLINFLNIDILSGIIFKLSNQAESVSGMGDFVGRRSYYLNGLYTFLSYPITGVGFGNIPQLVEQIDQNNLSSAHFSLLTVAAQQGIVVLFLVVKMLILDPLLDIRAVGKTGNQQLPEYILSKIFFVAFGGVLVQSTMYDILFLIDINFCVFMFIILCLYFIRHDNNKSVDSKKTDVNSEKLIINNVYFSV